MLIGPFARFHSNLRSHEAHQYGRRPKDIKLVLSSASWHCRWCEKLILQYHPLYFTINDWNDLSVFSRRWRDLLLRLYCCCFITHNFYLWFRGIILEKLGLPPITEQFDDYRIVSKNLCPLKLNRIEKEERINPIKEKKRTKRTFFILSSFPASNYLKWAHSWTNNHEV